jgi:hypothetical protein
MRNILKLAFATAGVLAGGAAFAQTCASPSTWTPDAAGAPVQSGTTCGGTDSVSLFCGALDSAGKPDVVYRVTLAAAGPQRTATSITIAGGGAGFTPTMNMYSDACNTADACVQNGDPTSPVPLAGVGAGTYFLTVSATAFDASGACGAFTMSTNGTFPVSLQNFSVE